MIIVSQVWELCTVNRRSLLLGFGKRQWDLLKGVIKFRCWFHQTIPNMHTQNSFDLPNRLLCYLLVTNLFDKYLVSPDPVHFIVQGRQQVRRTNTKVRILFDFSDNLAARDNTLMRRPSIGVLSYLPVSFSLVCYTSLWEHEEVSEDPWLLPRNREQTEIRFKNQEELARKVASIELEIL